MMNTAYQKPTIAELRKFGLLFSSFLLLIFGILLPLFRHWNGPEPLFSSLSHWPAWPWPAAAAIAGWALVHPASLFLLHRPWMKFAEIAGWVNTRIIMLLLFYLLIMPMGLLMRAFGHDPMRRKFDKNAESYRIISKPHDRDHMKAPY